MSVPAITLQPAACGKPLSKPQKAFNTLVGKIARARKRLERWHAAMQRATQAQAAQIDPEDRARPPCSSAPFGLWSRKTGMRHWPRLKTFSPRN